MWYYTPCNKYSQKGPVIEKTSIWFLHLLATNPFAGFQLGAVVLRCNNTAFPSQSNLNLCSAVLSFLVGCCFVLPYFAGPQRVLDSGCREKSGVCCPVLSVCIWGAYSMFCKNFVLQLLRGSHCVSTRLLLQPTFDVFRCHVKVITYCVDLA